MRELWVVAVTIQPQLPYNGSSGWSGGKTSRDRANHEDKTGITGERQRAVMSYLAGAGFHGGTWREIADYLELHHGQASAALSVLHKTGHIMRLSSTRGAGKHRSGVYVLPEYVMGREVKPHRENKSHPCPNCGWTE